jgi:hypothetical protein
MTDSEDKKAVRKALNKAKWEKKKAKRTAARAAEKAQDQERRDAARKRKEALAITIVDGNVVDEQGRVIRPYTRTERFLDNKPLVYTLLIVFIIVCLLLTLMFML